MRAHVRLKTGVNCLFSFVFEAHDRRTMCGVRVPNAAAIRRNA